MNQRMCTMLYERLVEKYNDEYYSDDEDYNSSCYDSD